MNANESNVAATTGAISWPATIAEHTPLTARFGARRIARRASVIPVRCMIATTVTPTIPLAMRNSSHSLSSTSTAG